MASLSLGNQKLSKLLACSTEDLLKCSAVHVPALWKDVHEDRKHEGMRNKNG